jgi:hypothetical protein
LFSEIITCYSLFILVIQRYDLDPAAKAAAASVLASKLGADSGLRIFLGDESNMDGNKSNDQHGQPSGLRQRKPAHSGHGSGQIHASDPSDGSSIYDGNESPTADRRTVEHFRGHAGNDGGWLARVAALLVGEDPTQCFALICGSCHMHNGRELITVFLSVGHVDHVIYTNSVSSLQVLQGKRTSHSLHITVLTVMLSMDQHNMRTMTWCLTLARRLLPIVPMVTVPNPALALQTQASAVLS